MPRLQPAPEAPSGLAGFRKRLEILRKGADHTAFAAEMDVPLSTLNNWQYGRRVRPPTARLACRAAKNLKINVGWFLEGPPHPMRLDRSRPDARLEDDMAAWIRHEGARAVKAPEGIRDLLPEIITADVAILELKRVAADLVQRVWRMEQRRQSFATVRDELQHGREGGSVDAAAMKALTTIESEDYFASGEHGGELGRAFRKDTLRQQRAAQPASRRTAMKTLPAGGRAAKR